MQLVQDEKPQSLSGPDKICFLGSRQNEFEHYVVGKQNIRRIGYNLILFIIGFLACISPECDRTSLVGIAEVDELFQFANLAIRQGIHWIYDDCLNTASWTVLEHMIDGWDNEGKTLSRACTCGQDVISTLYRNLDRIRLVSMEPKRASLFIRSVFDPKYSSALRMDNTRRNKFVNRFSRFEGRVQLDQWLRP